MSKKQAAATISHIMGLRESTRNILAIGIWLVVFVSLLFLSSYGQSQLMSAGLILQLTGAYSTFLLCGKSEEYGRFVHVVPYSFALTGAMLLCLAPDFPAPVGASLVFLAVTALMHWTVINGGRAPLNTEKTAFVTECLT